MCTLPAPRVPDRLPLRGLRRSRPGARRRTAPARRGRPVSPRVTFVADSDAWGGAEVYLTHLLRRAADDGWTASLVAAAPGAGGFTGGGPPDRQAAVPLARHRDDPPAGPRAAAAQPPAV